MAADPLEVGLCVIALSDVAPISKVDGRASQSRRSAVPPDRDPMSLDPIIAPSLDSAAQEVGVALAAGEFWPHWRFVCLPGGRAYRAEFWARAPGPEAAASLLGTVLAEPLRVAPAPSCSPTRPLARHGCVSPGRSTSNSDRSVRRASWDTWTSGKMSSVNATSPSRVALPLLQPITGVGENGETRVRTLCKKQRRSAPRNSTPRRHAR